MKLPPEIEDVISRFLDADLPEKQRILESAEGPRLLDPKTERVLREMAGEQTDSETKGLLSAHADLLAACRHLGIVIGLERWAAPLPIDDELQDLTIKFLNGDTLERRELLEGPDGSRLLSPIVEKFFLEQSKIHFDKDARTAFAAAASLLAYCREVGVGVFFDALEEAKASHSVIDPNQLVNHFIRAPLAEKRSLLEGKDGALLLNPSIEVEIRNTASECQDPEVEEVLISSAELLANWRRHGSAAADAIQPTRSTDTSVSEYPDFHDLIEAYVHADPSERRKMLEGEHSPRLLKTVVESELRNSAKLNDPDVAEHLIQCADFLATCRRYGVLVAYEIGGSIDRFIHSDKLKMREMIEGPEKVHLLDPRAENFLRDLANRASDDNSRESYNLHADLLADCRHRGIATAFGAWRVTKSFGEDDDSGSDHVDVDLVNRFLLANPGETRQMLVGPDARRLLDPSFEKLIRNVVKKKFVGEAEARIMLAKADFLAECRQNGVPAVSSAPAALTEAGGAKWSRESLSAVMEDLGKFEGLSLSALKRKADLCRQFLPSFNKGESLWGWLQYVLGTTLEQLGHFTGNTTYILESIEALESAVSVIDKKNNPSRWGAAQNSLGVAYLDQNDSNSDVLIITKAVAAFRHALEVVTLEEEPDQWAGTQSNLGNALLELDTLTHNSEAAKEALSAYENCLKVRSKARDPSGWAHVQMNLGNAFRHLNGIDGDPHHLVRAIGAFEAALEVYTKKDSPRAWATTLINLGGALTAVGRIDEGVRTFQRSLEILTRDEAPQLWAIANTALANGLERQNNLEAATFAYEKALQVYNLEGAPSDYVETAASLGCLLMQRGLYEDAVARLAPLLFDLITVALKETDESRQKLLLENVSQISDDLAYSQLRLPNPDPVGALETIGKSRGILLSLASAISLGYKHTDLPEARNTWRKAQFEAAQANDAADKVRYSGQAREIVASAFDRFHQLVASADLDGPQKVDVTELASAISSGGALVVPVMPTNGDGVVILLLSGEEEPKVLNLAGFNRAWFHEQLNVWFNGYSQFHESIGGDGPVQVAIGAWNKVIAQVLGAVSQTLMIPLHVLLSKLLADGSEVVIMPPGRLSFLPLHAAPIDNTTLFLDAWTVRFVANAQMLVATASLTHQRRGRRPRLLAVTNPTGDLGLEPPGAVDAYDSTEISPNPACIMFGETDRLDLRGRSGTIKAVEDNSEKSTHFSFYCHGFWDPEEPENSGLVLAGEEMLTVARMRTLNLTASRFAMLAACETGLHDLNKIPDEFTGLPFGMIEAGVPGIAASLWPIPVRPTRVLIRQVFYHMIRDRMPPPQALRTAQRNLRDQIWKEISERASKTGTDLSTEVGEGSQVRDFVSWAGFAFYGA